MAFDVKTWEDRVAEFPNRRRLDSTGITDTYDVARSEGAVSVEGDKINAANMNGLEGRISAAFAEQAEGLVTPAEKTAWDAGIVSTYIHTKTGTVHNLQGTGNNIEFLPTAGISDGDTWTVNGVAVTALLQNGEALPADLFKSGSWVTGVRLDGAKLGFKSAGGTVKYNVFCQPSEPPTKQGIWLKTAAVEAIKKIVFDTNTWSAEQWLADSGITVPAGLTDGSPGVIYQGFFYFFNYNGSYKFNLTTKIFTSIANPPDVTGSLAFAMVYNDKIYISGSYSTALYEYNPAANTYATKASRPGSANYAVSTIYNGKIYVFMNSGAVYCFNIAGGTWSTLTSISSVSGGNYGKAIAFGTKIYIMGFYGNKVNIYDPATQIATLSNSVIPINSGDAGFIVDDEIFYANTYSTNNMAAYKPITDTWRSLPTYVAGGNGSYGPVGDILGDKIYLFQLYYHKALIMELTAKQYSDNPTAVIQYLPNDTSHVASLVTNKICDYLPSYFKDAMLFKDTNLLYPELWLGNGTAWTKIREAQS